MVCKQPRDSIWLRGLLSCIISWKVNALWWRVCLSLWLRWVWWVSLAHSHSLSFSVYLSLSFCSHLVTAPIDLVKMTKWGNNMSRRPAMLLCPFSLAACVFSTTANSCGPRGITSRCVRMRVYLFLKRFLLSSHVNECVRVKGGWTFSVKGWDENWRGNRQESEHWDESVMRAGLKGGHTTELRRGCGCVFQWEEATVRGEYLF